MPKIRLEITTDVRDTQPVWETQPIRDTRLIKDRAIQLRATRQQPTCSVPVALPHSYLYPSLLCLDLAALGLLDVLIAGWLLLGCTPLALPLLDT